MRRMSAAGAAIVLCLTIGWMPVVAQEPAVILVWGTISDCVQTAPGTSVPWGDEDGVQVRDMVVTCTVTETEHQGGSASHPGISGTSIDWIDYAKPTGTLVWMTPWLGADAVAWGTTEITDPDGGWVGTWARSSGLPYTLVAQGTGANAGWTLVASMPATTPPLIVEGGVWREARGGDFLGVIYQGPPPPFGPLPSPAGE